MGFECGFNKIKKYKDFSLDKILNIKYYCEYLKWDPELKEKYTYEECWNMYYKDENGNFCPDEPKQEEVDEYLAFIGNEEIEQNIDCWFSRGAYLDSGIVFFRSLDSIDCHCLYSVNDNFIKEAREWIYEELNENDLTPVTIKQGYVKDGEDNVEFKEIDGIQIQELYDEYSRILLDKDITVYVPSIRFNLDDYETLKTFESFLKELEKIDFDEYYVIYYRSF